MTRRVKEFDVFSLSLDNPKKMSDCFEGVLIAKKFDGRIFLYDTYWGIRGNSQNHRFTVDQAEKMGTLRYRFNLSDYQFISEEESKYYLEDDLEYITEQHACAPSCCYHLKKKGALRDRETMLFVINKRIGDTKYKIKSLKGRVQWYLEAREKIQKGDTDISIY